MRLYSVWTRAARARQRSGGRSPTLHSAIPADMETISFGGRLEGGGLSMTLSDVKALTFDVFGTVVDYRGTIIREGERTAGRLGTVCRCLARSLSSLDGSCHAGRIALDQSRCLTPPGPGGVAERVPAQRSLDRGRESPTQSCLAPPSPLPRSPSLTHALP